MATWWLLSVQLCYRLLALWVSTEPTCSGSLPFGGLAEGRLRGITRRRCPPKERPLRVRDATFVASPRIPPPRTNSRTGQAGDATAVFLDLEIGQFAKALQHG
jgi:hypothetical protein